MHNRIIEMGYKMKFLPPESLTDYIFHLNHATMVLNQDFGLQVHSIRKGKRRIERMLAEIKAEEILAANTLDIAT